ncbi:tryptophan--tRNA ligase [Patescibacteria group bacterium]|nr:MAG: tryptophan--tRNA ligase [Patescibacteria group bacterium]
MSNHKHIIVSGIQPTGNLHIGNYLGAVKNWVDLQNSGKYEMYIFIADLHSLSGKMTPDELRAQTRTTAAELLAAGIDPKKTTFYFQSRIAGHAELAWILNCLTPMSELERMTQYKDKTAQLKMSTAGLFTYPILQAADILMYKGEMVPVGQDQIQHVELTRDIARWFNKKYGAYFPETKHLLTETPKVMSLLEPNKKMSKSLGADHVIEMADEPGVIEQKIKRAVTATEGGGQAPGVINLLMLLQKFESGLSFPRLSTGESSYERFVKAEKDGTIRYGELKDELAKAIANYFADFRAKRAELLKNPAKLDKIMRDGAAKAQKVADKTMEGVRNLIGL